VAKKVRLEILADGRQAEKEFGKVNKSISGTIKKLAVATVSIYALKKAFDLSTVLKNSARDAEETTNKFLTVYESIQDSATKTADVLAESYGMASTTAMELLGNTGDLLVGFGFAEDKALEMSKAVNELAVDLASFQNYAGGAEGASVALTKAILGETESAKALGIVIRQDTKWFKNNVKMLVETTGVTEQQAKAQTIMQIAYKQSSKAVGDFGRTQHQLANKERILEERVKNLKEELGKGLIPVFGALTTASIGIVDTFTEKMIPVIQELATEMNSPEFQKDIQEMGEDISDNIVWGIENRKAIFNTAGALIALNIGAGIVRNASAIGGALTMLFAKGGALIETIRIGGMYAGESFAVGLASQASILAVALTSKGSTSQEVIDWYAEEGRKAGQVYYKNYEAMGTAFQQSPEEYYKGYAEYLESLYPAKDIQKEVTEEVEKTVSAYSDLNFIAKSFGESIPDNVSLFPEKKLSFESVYGFSVEAIREQFLGAWGDIQGSEFEQKQAHLDSMAQMYKDASVNQLMIDQWYAIEKKKLDEEILQSKLSSVSGMLGAFGELNKAMKGSGRASQAIAIAQAIIDTYAGANKALASAPPPFNYIAMAGVIASGLANVINIKKQKFSSGGDFTVPAGYPNDSYPIFVESGERVQITPASGGGNTRTDELIGILIQTLENKPVANTLIMDAIDMARYVDGGNDQRVQG